ncbi:MAG: cytochrome c oxidase assembly protein [Candidatus Binatota bacterium]|nr:cytochrome c oxidase assembly protein [Candidatus Binatota bacterium]
MKIANLLWSAAAAILLVLPPYYLLSAPNNGGQSGPVRTINSYLKSAYAHDHKKAYRLISNRDRQIKSEDLYIQEKGPFSGFTLTVAGKLAEMIEVRPIGATENDATTKVKFNIKLPDANSLSALLLDWDQDKLNALPEPKQKEVLAAIDAQRRAGKLKFIEGEEELTLVKENGLWRVLFDWAAGLRVQYDAVVPQNEAIEATPLTRETSVRANELFTIAYRVRNTSQETVATRIVHRVEPQELRQHLDLVECALLLPVRLKAGEDREFSSTYMVRGDLPDGSKQVKVIYDFKIEK